MAHVVRKHKEVAPTNPSGFDAYGYAQEPRRFNQYPSFFLAVNKSGGGRVYGDLNFCHRLWLNNFPFPASAPLTLLLLPLSGWPELNARFLILGLSFLPSYSS